MDLSLNESQQMLKDTVRRFMERECSSVRVKEFEATETGFPAEIWDGLAKLGMVGLGIPEQYGGGGGSYQDLGVLYHELGRACAPVPHFSSAVLSAEILLEAASEAQKSELLPRIASGELIMVPAITEPEVGWTASSVQLSATKQGDAYILQGTKLFVPDAQMAHQLIVAARTGSNPAADVTLFLVDAKAPGVGIRNLSGFFATGRVNEITLDSVKVGASAVVGAVGEGWAAVDAAMTRTMPVLCAYMVGGCEVVFEMTRDYCGTRIAFGQPIGTFQRVQDHVIELVNGMDAAKWTTAEALWKVDEKKSDWKIAASLAKAVASDGYHTATFQAHEVHAGAGSIVEHPLHLYTRSARTLYWYLGDPTFHRRRIADLMEL